MFVYADVHVGANVYVYVYTCIQVLGMHRHNV